MFKKIIKNIIILFIFFLIFLPSMDDSYPFEQHIRGMTNWIFKKDYNKQFERNPGLIEAKNQVLSNYYKEYFLEETNKKAKEIKIKISILTYLSITKRLIDNYDLTDYLKNKIKIIKTDDKIIEINLLEYYKRIKEKVFNNNQINNDILCYIIQLF
ncbi:hypothetical protein Mgra_00004648, partial [Meloidogyne graminicola]